MTEDCLKSVIKDAVSFAVLLPNNIPEPIVSVAEDQEIVFEWACGNKKAIVGFEGNGFFGYTLYTNGEFKPGAFQGCLKNKELPFDLLQYLTE